LIWTLAPRRAVCWHGPWEERTEAEGSVESWTVRGVAGHWVSGQAR